MLDRLRYTSIDLLLTGGAKFNFHRVLSKETFQYLEGEDMIIHIIDMNGNYHSVMLGALSPNTREHCTIEPGNWFAESSLTRINYTLLRVTNEPGFHPDDVVQATRHELLSLCGENQRIYNIIQIHTPD